jgi:gliding motility-associated-like protein
MLYLYKQCLNERITNARHAVRLEGAHRWQSWLIVILFLSSFQSVWAQHTVQITTTNLAASDCSDRVLTGVVRGGIGPFEYAWNSSPPSSVFLGDGNSITVSPMVTTTYRLFVYDDATGITVRTTVTVTPRVTGDFEISPPPNVMTPNGDGINDTWQVRSPNNGFAPIRANAYGLQIYNRWGTQIYSTYYQENSVGPGIVGGQIQWNAAGASSNGVYYWYLTLYNCDKSQSYNDTVDIFGLAGRAASTATLSSQALAIYPNPVSDELTIRPAQLLHGDLALAERDAKQTSTAEYRVELVDKFSQVQRSMSSREAEVRLDVRSLPEGTYFLHLTQGRKTTRQQIKVSH